MQDDPVHHHLTELDAIAKSANESYPRGEHGDKHTVADTYTYNPAVRTQRNSEAAVQRGPERL